MDTAEYMKNKVERTFFPVRKEAHPEGRMQIVDGNGRTISRVSERYCLIPNKDIVTPFIERFGYENIDDVRVQGNRFTYKFNISEKIDIGEGDFVRPQAIVGTSYDKTARVWVMGGMMRQVCGNGMFGLMLGINFSSLHLDNVPWKDMVSGAVNSCRDFNVENWRKLRKVPLTLERKEELVRGFKPYELEETHENWWEKSCNEKKAEDILSRSLREIKRPESLNNQHNAWGLMNNINRAVADSFTQSNVREVIKLNVKLEDYLMKSLSLN